MLGQLDIQMEILMAFPDQSPAPLFLPSTTLFSLGTGASETLLARKSLLSCASGDLPSARLVS